MVMVLNPILKTKEYTVLFTLSQPEKNLKELNTLKNSLPKILKKHRVNVITESQPYGDGFLVFLYVLLKETKYLRSDQHIVEMRKLLRYVDELIGERLTTGPKPYNGNFDNLSFSKSKS